MRFRPPVKLTKDDFCVLKPFSRQQCITELNPKIIQGCKQKHACRNEVDQNRGYAENESKKQYQCNPVNRANSVCRCCCETTECNQNAEYCIKPPKCAYPTITNGRFICENSGNIGDKCDIVCDDGYECDGEKTRKLDCRPDGTWNGVVPSCVAIPTTTTTKTATTTKTTRAAVTTERTIPMTTQLEPLTSETNQATNQIQQECSKLETGVIGLMVSIFLLLRSKYFTI